MSSDFEDITFVLNNRNTIWEEMQAAPDSVKEYLKAEFGNLSKSNFLYEWISVHLDYTEQKRTAVLIGGLEQFIRS
jgi:hypothetical protein